MWRSGISGLSQWGDSVWPTVATRAARCKMRIFWGVKFRSGNRGDSKVSEYWHESSRRPERGVCVCVCVWGSVQTGHSPIPPSHTCLVNGNDGSFFLFPNYNLRYANDQSRISERKRIDNIRGFFWGTQQKTCSWKNLWYFSRGQKAERHCRHMLTSMSPAGKPSGKLW